MINRTINDEIGKTAIVILNYNTWDMTLNLVAEIKSINRLSKCDIIVVDNNSPNDSQIKLKQKADETGDFILLLSQKNSGYAAGNNIGLRYAYTNGYDFAWVLNNDVLLTDEYVLDKIIKVFGYDENIAVVSPDILFSDGRQANRELVRPNVFDMTLGAIRYKTIGRKSKVNEEWSYGYRPQGCCMVLDLKKVSEVDYMDEYTFLYCEEPILAERLLKKGYLCACCFSTSIIHNHSFTVKNTLSKARFIKTNIRSFDYLLKKYRGYNIISRAICDLFYILRLFVTKQV